ncbi:hypothetical protein D9758_008370 [Tetrapyrgos nigripes]|uniref:GmrSD restriction endonucleases N-terminal domain-containing protein n=1 Tax=Tetrapyrgos nigripes TaxID=182062 RepID=A0A8H5LN33_9AGAR|nr:hypothetical protein D9758_008370 [Tetrapyrgos nigripes]
MSEPELPELPELSELSEEEETALADAQNAASSQARRAIKAEKRDEDEYRLQRALRPPRATTYTAQALYEQIHSGDVNLEPEYQRDVVWTKEKQTGLIDSILRNFYIPPIIFVVNTDDAGNETKTCIDGKQRLTSIHRFMDGLIPHRDPSTNEKFWYQIDPSVHGGKKVPAARLLPPQYRKSFAGKQIVCVEYTDLTDSDEREIFQRVQLGMALTSAEKLHVIATPRAQFIRSLLNTHVSDDTLGDPKLPWDRSRGGDFRCISQAVFVMSKWTSSPLSGAGTLAQVEKWLTETGEGAAGSGRGARAKAKTTTGKGKRGPGRPRKTKPKPKAEDEDEDMEHEDEEDEEDQIEDGDYIDAPQVPEAFAKKVRDTYDLFVELTRDPKLKKPFVSYPKVSPIEMICIAILIFVHGVNAKSSEKLSPSELSAIIASMRAKVRLEHKDIRMNDRVGKFMIEFIRNVRKEDVPSLSASASAGKASATSGKRKRQLDGAVDEDEYDDNNDDNDDDKEYGVRSTRSRRKSTTRRKTEASPTQTRMKTKAQQPTPAPSMPSESASAGGKGGGGRRSLAALRDARNSISAPVPANPQSLPSPSPGEPNSNQPSRPASASTSTSTAVKTEPHSASLHSGLNSAQVPNPNNGAITPELMQHIIGLQMMGFSPMPPGMQHPQQHQLSQHHVQHQQPSHMGIPQMSQVPMMMPGVPMSQPGMGMPGHNAGPGPQRPGGIGMDTPISIAQMQQWMQTQQAQGQGQSQGQQGQK